MNITDFFNPHSFVGTSTENTESKPEKLIYRGFTYDYIPRLSANYHPLTTPLDTVETEKVQLIYRGQKNDYIRRRFPAYRHPVAINWRYQSA